MQSSSSRQVDVDVAAVPESREDVEADGVPVVAYVVVLSEKEDVVAPNADLEVAGSENINCILIKISFIMLLRLDYLSNTTCPDEVKIEVALVFFRSSVC